MAVEAGIPPIVAPRYAARMVANATRRDLERDELARQTTSIARPHDAGRGTSTVKAYGRGAGRTRVSRRRSAPDRGRRGRG